MSGDQSMRSIDASVYSRQTETRRERSPDDLGPCVLARGRTTSPAHRRFVFGVGTERHVELHELGWIARLKHERIPTGHHVVLTGQPGAADATYGHRFEPHQPERLHRAIREHDVRRTEQCAAAI